ncbi:UNC-like C-terminal-domain-containing protein [Parasitella parasitica]|nr:UNC-like C-terminal-domain-containing protein [Parasitella parasitica]
MHLSRQLLIHSFIILPLVLSAKTTYKPKQCLRYRDNDIFAETCPTYSQETVDFSAALFPDAAVISGLSKPHIIEKSDHDHTVTETVDNGIDSPIQLPALPQTKETDASQNQPSQHNNDRTNSNVNYTGQEIQQEQEAIDDKRKPLVSFEEWQKKIAQIENDKERRHKRKTLEEEEGSMNKRQQMVDSIDGGFADDFGSMFEDLLGGVGGKDKKKPNVYAEGEYIAPSQSGSESKSKKKQQFADVRMKSLKERFNYASTDCAATVRKVNKQAKGAQSILYESKDQYLLNKCSADKFVIINLCEQIVVDTIVMANFEFFSSTFKDFRVYASSKYPSKDWRLLGQWQARNTRDLQVFRVPDSGFVEYMKIEFITHYGHEYYCPLSLVRVHGMSMMEYYNTVESQDQNPVLEEEHLWPAEVREQIIQPQFDITDSAESFPVKNDIDEDDIKPIIPPINIATETSLSSDSDDLPSRSAETTVEIGPVETSLEAPLEDIVTDQTSGEETGILETTIDHINAEQDEPATTTFIELSITPTDVDEVDQTPVSSPISQGKPSSSKSKAEKIKITVNKGKQTGAPSHTKRKASSVSTITNSSSTSIQVDNTINHSKNANEVGNGNNNNNNANSDTIDNSTGTVVSDDSAESDEMLAIENNEIAKDVKSDATRDNANTTISSATTAVSPQSSVPNSPSSPPSPKVVIPNAHQKDGSTQESIYKTIMKRLNVLEVNVTLSQRFLDDQNKILNNVFMDMEKRHQDQLIVLIGHLNETASYKIDSMKRRYEQWYEELKDQTESDMREMTAKISILADQLSFERRVSVSQLVIMITLFVFMALSRGTFSTLSPVMAAQQEERKRRESIDQSSAVSKEILDIVQKATDKTTDATVPSSPAATTEDPKSLIIRRLNEIPKKPNNPRRHSDSPYHTMKIRDSNQVDVVQKSNYASLGIEIQNELLHKKLDDLSHQLNNTSRKSSLEDLKESFSVAKTRERSSTSPLFSDIVL